MHIIAGKTESREETLLGFLPAFPAILINVYFWNLYY